MDTTTSAALRSLLRLATEELRQHNASYHWHTPEPFLEELEKASAGGTDQDLLAILERSAEALRQRRPPGVPVAQGPAGDSDDPGEGSE